LKKLLNDIPENVKLIAVSKTKPNKDIMELYDAGYRVFGENRPQELNAKQQELPGDIEWHFIGHLQTNKIKYIAPFVSLIHSVDSFKLLKNINKEAKKNNRVIPCLLQFHIADEESKFGLTYEKAIEILQSTAFLELDNVRISGVMGMATFTDDTEKINKEFAQLKHIFSQLKKTFFKQDENFKEISMGMSNDYKLALNQGATMLRIGSTIFGERNYQ
jgi:pyridoxal phosphate enzyme (YggS family)